MKRENISFSLRVPPVSFLTFLLLISSSIAPFLDGTEVVGDENDSVVSTEFFLEGSRRGERIPLDSSIFRGNNQRTGSFPYDTTDNPGLVKWVFQPNNAWVWSSPVLDENGIIYYGSGDTNLYAVYPNGTEKWHFGTGAGIQGSAAIGGDGTIYFGSEDRYFYALFPNGTLKWKLFTGEVRGTPAITENGTILVGGDGYLWAINPNGTEIWKTITGSYISSPAIGPDGTIYESSYLDYLYALFPNGTIKWRFKTGDFISVTPAVDSENNIYIGSWDGYFYSIFPNGTLNWKHYMPGTVNNNFHSSPGVDVFGDIYVTSPLGIIFKFKNNGSIVWTKQLPYILHGITTDQKGSLFFYTDGGVMYSLYRNSTFKWVVIVGDQGRADPTIGPGGIVYTASSAGLKAFGKREPLSPILTMNNSGNRFIHLNWTHPMEWNAPQLDDIKVYRKSDGNDYELISTLDGDKLDYNDTDVVNGWNYSYQLSAVSIYGESERSNSIWSTPFGIPDPPLNLKVEVGDEYAVLSWEDPDELGGSDIFGYELFIGESPYYLESKVFLGYLSYSYNFTDLQNGKEYYFGIKLSTYVHDSEMSDIVSGTPSIIPGPPINIKRIVVSNSIKIMWDPPLFDGGTSITAYHLFRNDEMIALLNPDAYEYSDTDCEYGVEYFYYLIAENSVGKSTRSNEVQAVLKNVPTPPSNLVGDFGDGYVNLSWLPPEDERGSPLTGYYIYRQKPNEVLELIKTIIGNFTYYHDSGLNNGNTYYYWVSAKNTIGESDPSNTITMIPLGFPSEPLDIIVSKVGSSIQITWSTPEKNGGLPITGYLIYRFNGTHWKTYETDNSPYVEDDIDYGFTYTYRVSAVNSQGEGVQSIGVVIGYFKSPSEPLNLKVVQVEGKISLSWDPPEGNENDVDQIYNIYREVKGVGNVTLISSTPLTTYLDSNISFDIIYVYTISAVNEGGEGNQSEGVTIQTVDPSELNGDDVDNKSGSLWLIAIVSIIIVLVLIGAVAGFIFTTRKQEPDEVYEEQKKDDYDPDTKGWVELEVPDHESSSSTKSDSLIPKMNFINTREGVFTFLIISLLIFGSIIIFNIVQYHEANNWIAAHSYRDAAIMVAIPAGLTVLAIITASFKLIKVTAVISIIGVILSLSSFVSIIGGLFLVFAFISCLMNIIRKNKMRKCG